MTSLPWLQALSLVASTVIVVFAFAFGHPIVGCAGAVTFLYSIQEND